jgi:hypothetical protein
MLRVDGAALLLEEQAMVVDGPQAVTLELLGVHDGQLIPASQLPHFGLGQHTQSVDVGAT